ncbi:MAG TPA: phospho-sugar mutase [Acidimicrobiales bacterium]|nr:phospho-sugar mutase [Acidimicrobiales bacterium]
MNAAAGGPIEAGLPSELVTNVKAWVAQDPDPATRAELEGLLAQGDEAALRDRFDNPLSFGTAGLRGPLGAGPARMNRAVARRATAGLVQHVLHGTSGFEGAPGPRRPGEVQLGIVVGHDARHLSAEMAEDVARTVGSRGLRAWWLKRALPTPIAAFAVRHFGAAAGVQVTASHNPAPDNGYKVYLSDGAQVIPPHDAEIAAAAAETSMPTDAELSGPFGELLVEVDEDELLASYRKAVLAVVETERGGRATVEVARARAELRTVYTPVHGVGGAVMPRLLEEAGFRPPFVVAAQAEPDPDFPTAAFPNPEEPGVLDLALADATRLGADLVLANDPDADRLAVAVPSEGAAGRAGGAYRALSGDELGILLADHLIRATTGANRLVATTIVSSTMLSDLARSAGVAYVETLTGFKWVARAAGLQPGHRLLFGYEEALGYAVTDAVADKDGMSAALVVADMAARAKLDGRSLLARLDELDAALGVHATLQWSLRVPGADAVAKMAGIMATLRSAPPSSLGVAPVTRARDLLHGEAELPSSDLLLFYMDGYSGGEARVVLRPSGTEPKLKVYFEVKTAPCELSEVAEVRQHARARIEELRREMAGLLQA